MPIVTVTVHAMYDAKFTGCFMSLLKSAPALDGTGATEFTAVDFVEYVRKAITFASAASRAKSNSVAVLFASSVASGTGATATHFGIHSAATLGTMFAWGALTSPFAIGVGSLVNFPIGQVTITNLGTS